MFAVHEEDESCDRQNVRTKIGEFGIQDRTAIPVAGSDQLLEDQTKV
jgi:hypothetical protein